MSISPSVRVHCFAPALCSVVTLAVVSLLLPASAGAYATPGPAPVPGSPGLPDGRIYELVSPGNKPGSEADPGLQGESKELWAAADGDAVGFFTNGPMGDAASGVEEWAVSKRSGGNWQTYSAMPLPLVGPYGSIQERESRLIGFSADFTRSIFNTSSSFVAGQPGGSLTDFKTDVGNVYDTETGTTLWLGEPLASHVLEHFPGYEYEYTEITGVSSNLSTVYFSSQGGYYEWHEGQVTPVGVLPDGSVDPYGAVPAGLDRFGAGGPNQNAEDTANEVSEDGSRAFFVAPSPASCKQGNDCAANPPELYVRETAANGTQRTVLVSKDTLLPAVDGLPAAAPHGPLRFKSAAGYENSEGSSYVWATPDGTRAFFVSTDQLTPEASADDSGKLYEFNLETETLTYLAGATPAVTDPTEPGYPEGAEVLAASPDGSRLLFAKFASNGNRPQRLTELDLWTDGPEGPRDGSVTPIAPLEMEEGSSAFPFTRVASDGSSFVFETKAAFPGYHFNNGEAAPGSNGREVKFEQVYRYEVATNSLTCLSCAPAGVAITGDAQLTPIHGNSEPTLNKERGISENGERVFFDTPEPLVPWDSNTAPPAVEQYGLQARGYDVYEWENGKLYLISTGKSTAGSFVGDNSANGNNVFFATAEGLVPGDTNGGYDVYDARIPEPGEKTASAVPCEGEVCQGPPSVPSLLGAPASATFSGLGNPAPTVPAPAVKPAVPKSLTSAQKLSAALRACGKQPKRKRARCKAQARKKYAPEAKKSNRGGR